MRIMSVMCIIVLHLEQYNCNAYKTVSINNKGNYAGCDELPDINKIRAEGISSSGLINLMRLSVGLKMPNMDSYGLQLEDYSKNNFWFKYFTHNNLCDEYSSIVNYPHGTLLMSIIEPYHMAVIYKKKESPFETMHSKILHAYIDEKHPAGGEVGETILLYFDMITYNEIVDTSNRTYFNKVVLPDNWLSTNVIDPNIIIHGTNKN